jgi:hypothetical protein
MPVGVVPLDAQTRDPVLPTQAVGWSSVHVLVASAPLLARAGQAEQEALADWVRGGGRVIVFPRSDADFRDPFLRSLVGDLARVGAEPRYSTLVPQAAQGQRLTVNGQLGEEFGASRRVGFGRVYVASFDGSAPPFSEAAETRALVRAIAAAPRQHGVDWPVLPFGQLQDQVGAEWFGSGPSFGTLRSTLDPNEGYRPALGLVAVVLLLYVIAIGPVNFTFVQRRNRPTLALLTTPIAAFFCALVMLGVGYVGKGTTMRFRAVEVVELVEGDASGPARRYTGLFYTRPASLELSSPEHGIVRVLRGATSDVAPVTDHAGERPVLRELRGRLWETVFVREDRIAPLGGTIRFTRDGRRLAAVENGTPHALRGAVVIDPAGAVYPVGDVPAGGRAAISSASSMSLTAMGGYYYGGQDPAVVQLARAMRFPEDDDKIVEGLHRLFAGSLSTPTVPILLAWTDNEERPFAADAFLRERDLRFLRVVPDLEGGGSPVGAVP